MALLQQFLLNELYTMTQSIFASNRAVTRRDHSCQGFLSTCKRTQLDPAARKLHMLLTARSGNGLRENERQGLFLHEGIYLTPFSQVAGKGLHCVQ